MGSHPNLMDLSPVGRDPYLSVTGAKGNQEARSTLGKYRSGGTRGTLSGMDICLDLSPRAKPYCGVECSPSLKNPSEQ